MPSSPPRRTRGRARGEPLPRPDRTLAARRRTFQRGTAVAPARLGTGAITHTDAAFTTYACRVAVNRPRDIAPALSDRLTMIYLLLTGRYVVAFVLFAAGVSKVRDRVHGVEVVERYGILPRWSVPAVAAFLPWCEVVLAAGLAAGIQPSLAGLLACALFAQFAAAIA